MSNCTKCKHPARELKVGIGATHIDGSGRPRRICTHNVGNGFACGCNEAII